METLIFDFIESGVSTLDDLIETFNSNHLENEITDTVNNMTERGLLLRYDVEGHGLFYTLNTFRNNGIDKIYRLIRAGVNTKVDLVGFTGDDVIKTRGRIQALKSVGKIISNKKKTHRVRYMPNPDYKMPDYEKDRIRVYDSLRVPQTIPQLCKRFNINRDQLRHHVCYLLENGSLDCKKIDGKQIKYWQKPPSENLYYSSKESREAANYDQFFFNIIRNKYKNAS